MADRATIANMAPEYGATCGFFPVDGQILDYLRLTGRPQERLALVEAYCKENALWHESGTHPEYSQVVDLDLDAVEPSLAGPRRPQDRVPLRVAKESFLEALPSFNGVLRAGRRTRRSPRRFRRATRPPVSPQATTRFQRKSSWRPPSRTGRSAPSS